MDPSKSASVSPQEKTGDKSSMGQSPPPPYFDSPNQGYPQPVPGYQPQAQAYEGQMQYGGVVYAQQYPAQQATITAQPTVYVTQGPLANPVNDYLCYSIFTMLCCCLPLGVAALIYSISAREANHIGDRLGAERSSRTARTLNHVALGLGLGGFILFIVYIVVMFSFIR